MTVHGFLKSTFDKNPTPIHFNDFIERIRNGTYKVEADKIRAFINGGPDKTSDVYKSQLAKLKQQLPGLVPSLLYTPGERTGGALSGVLCIDYDDCDGDVGNSVEPLLFIKRLQEVRGSKHLLAACTSISGRGVAAFYRYNISQIVFIDQTGATSSEFDLITGTPMERFRRVPKANFGFIMTQMENAGFILPSWDAQVKDFSRLRFISYDPDCYYNPDVEPLDLVISVAEMILKGKRNPTIVYQVVNF